MTKIFLKNEYLTEKDYIDALKPNNEGELDLEYLKQYYKQCNPELSIEDIEKQIFANTIVFNFVQEEKPTTKK